MINYTDPRTAIGMCRCVLCVSVKLFPMHSVTRLFGQKWDEVEWNTSNPNWWGR